MTPRVKPRLSARKAAAAQARRSFLSTIRYRPAGSPATTRPCGHGRRSQATNLRVFGSVARGLDKPDSDLDLLADLPPGLGLFGVGRLQAALESVIGTHVDLIPAADLKPDVRRRVERELVPL